MHALAPEPQSKNLYSAACPRQVCQSSAHLSDSVCIDTLPVQSTYNNCAYVCMVVALFKKVPCAGLLYALTEKPGPAEQDMHPGAEKHVLQYLMSARPFVIVRLAAYDAAKRGSLIKALSFAHCNRIALALKYSKRRWRGTEELEASTRLLAQCLTHKIRYSFKKCSGEQIKEATEAVVNVLYLEDAGVVLKNLASTFEARLLRTSNAQTKCISTNLVCSCSVSLQSTMSMY